MSRAVHQAQLIQVGTPVGRTSGCPGPAVLERGSGVGRTSFLQQVQMDMDAWPLRSYLALGAQAGAVPAARLHARLLVHEWGLNELAETVELIVSELVTNSVQASEGLTDSCYNGRWRPGKPPVRLWLESDGIRILVHVWDANDQLPEQQEPELDAEHGRGLLIVESLSARFGVYRPERSSGKVVWALCDC